MTQSMDFPSNGGRPEAPSPERRDLKEWRYDCELSPAHIDSVLIDPVKAGNPRARFKSWIEHLENHDDRLGYVAKWIESAISQLPAGIDLARDVDGGGYTDVSRVEPCMFTQWVQLENGSYVRFAKARTAMHNTMFSTRGTSEGGALRSPVMGGVALETTSDPDSIDPRDAVTLGIYQFPRTEDARYPWLPPRKGRLFDMTEFQTEPYTVGPLYNGHPNELTSEGSINRAIDAAVAILEQVYNH